MNAAAATLHPLIASAVPGRLRLRAAALRKAGPLAAVQGALGALEGVAGLEANEQAGSVVVRYDPRLVAPAAMLAGVVATAAPLLPPAPARKPPPAAARAGGAPTAAVHSGAAAPQAPLTRRERKAAARRKRHLRHQVNLAAKVGMLASLGVSLVLAAAGVKKWHAATGVVFCGLLAVHLATHRKHILR